MMAQEYWLCQPYIGITYWNGTLPSRKEMFMKMLEEIPKLIGMHRSLGLRYFKREVQLLTRSYSYRLGRLPVPTTSICANC